MRERERDISKHSRDNFRYDRYLALAVIKRKLERELKINNSLSEIIIYIAVSRKVIY